MNEFLVNARGRYLTKYENLLSQHETLIASKFLEISQAISIKENILLRDANFSLLNLLQKDDESITKESEIYHAVCKNNATILRYLATCIREGFDASLAKKLLAHIITDLTSREYFENQIHILLESLQCNLNKESIRIIKPILEETLQYYQNAHSARIIQEKITPIVEQTTDLVFRINSQLSNFYTKPQTKKNIELILKAFCEILKQTNKELHVEAIACFCAQEVFPNLEKFPGDILLAIVLSLLESITTNIDLDISFSIAETYDKLIDLVEEITIAGNLYKKCDDILLSASHKIKHIQRNSPITNEQIELEIKNPIEKLIKGISRLISGGEGTNKKCLAQLWTIEVLPIMPVQEMSFIGETLRNIAQSTQENVDAYTNEVFLESLLTITDIVRKMSVTSHIFHQMDLIYKQTVTSVHQNNRLAVETTIDLNTLLKRIIHTALVFCSSDSLENNEFAYRSFIVHYISEHDISIDLVIESLQTVERLMKETLKSEDFLIIQEYVVAAKQVYQLKAKLDEFTIKIDDTTEQIVEILISSKTIEKEQDIFIQNTLTIIINELVTLALKNAKGEVFHRYFLDNVLTMINVEPDVLSNIFFVMREKISLSELQLLIKDLQHEIPKLVAGVRAFKQSRQLAYDCSDKILKKIPKQTVEKIGKLSLIKDLETILRGVGYVLTSERVSSNTKQWFQDRVKFQIHVINAEIFASIKKQIGLELREWFSEIESSHIENALSQMYS